jgi:hypothetical protein
MPCKRKKSPSNEERTKPAGREQVSIRFLARDSIKTGKSRNVNRNKGNPSTTEQVLPCLEPQGEQPPGGEGRSKLRLPERINVMNKKKIAR